MDLQARIASKVENDRLDNEPLSAAEVIGQTAG